MLIGCISDGPFLKSLLSYLLTIFQIQSGTNSQIDSANTCHASVTNRSTTKGVGGGVGEGVSQDAVGEKLSVTDGDELLRASDETIR